VSAGSQSRTRYKRGVPKYKPGRFGSDGSELGPGVVGVSNTKMLPPWKGLVFSKRGW
jgi:hypothetical protein